MKYLHIKTLLCSILVLVVLSGCREKMSDAAGSADVISDKVAVVTLSRGDWQTATDSAVGLLESGLTSLNPQTTASYTSPVLEAPQPFNYVVPEWQAQLPPGSILQIKVRTSVGAEQWSEWYEVQENPDMQKEESVWKTGTFIERPESAETLGQAQFQIDFIPSPDGKAPILVAQCYGAYDARDFEPKEQQPPHQIRVTTHSAESHLTHPMVRQSRLQLWRFALRPCDASLHPSHRLQ